MRLIHNKGFVVYFETIKPLIIIYLLTLYQLSALI